MVAEDDGKALSRVQTGVPGLDFILGGGIYQGSVYLIEGVPGAGKTVLSTQISFNLAASGKTVVYLTLIAESHAKLINHLRTMSFFQRSCLGDRIHLLSGYQELRRGGYARLLELIVGITRQQEPYLLVIDGFRQGGPATEQEVLAFVHDLSAFMMTVRCTTLLLTPHTAERRAEDVLVDGVIELTRQPVGMRTISEMEVHKMRAAAHAHGRHFFQITADGLAVYPRLESSISDQITLKENSTRLQFDIPKLDTMLRGGLFKGSVTSLAGSPGSGKTLLGLSFLLAGARKGERALYFGFYESPARLLAKADAIGLRAREATEAGLLEVLWRPPSEHLLDELAHTLLAAVDRGSVQRLFIDGVDGLRSSAVYPERVGRFLAVLTSLLRARQVTVILTEELPIFATEIQTPVTELSATVENLILMRQVELRSQLYRLISIMKLRESGYDSSIREFTISEKGIDIASSFESAEAILSGQARVSAYRGEI